MAKLRRTLPSDPEFIRRLKQIQGKMKSRDGREPSLTDLTTEMIRVPAFEDVEKQILEKDRELGMRIRMDGKIGK